MRNFTVKHASISMIDIGLNLTSPRFDKDRHAVLDKAHTAGLTHAIITGSDPTNSAQAIQLCEQFIEHPLRLYSTVGVHPHHAELVTDASCQQLAELATVKHVVAMGEMGLDFFRNLCPPAIQEKAFEMQLQLAIDNGKPVFLHQRDAHSRFYDILKQCRDQLSNVIVHCFTDTQAALFDYLDLDCHIGITGWICDERRGLDLQKIVNNIPLNRLMIETDAPYLQPRNIRPRPKNNRNEPAYLNYVLNQVAHCMGETVETIAEVTTKNSIEFFGINHSA